MGGMQGLLVATNFRGCMTITLLLEWLFGKAVGQISVQKRVAVVVCRHN